MAVRLVVCDLSASPYIDLAGSRMLLELNSELTRLGIALRIVGAHGSVRDLLRAEGLEEKVGGLTAPGRWTVYYRPIVEGAFPKAGVLRDRHRRAAA